MQYYLLVNNKAEGPFTKDELYELSIFPELLVKTNEAENWQPESQFDDLQGFFNTTVNSLETSKIKINSIMHTNNNSSKTKNWIWVIVGIVIILFAVLLLFLVQSQKQQELQLQLNELNSAIQQNELQKPDTAKHKQPPKIEVFRKPIYFE